MCSTRPSTCFSRSWGLYEGASVEWRAMCARSISRSLEQVADAMDCSSPALGPPDTAPLHSSLRRAEVTTAGPSSAEPARTPLCARKGHTVIIYQFIVINR